MTMWGLSRMTVSFFGPPERHRKPTSAPLESLSFSSLVPVPAFDWETAGSFDYLLIYDRDGGWKKHYRGAPYPKVYARNGWIVLRVE